MTTTLNDLINEVTINLAGYTFQQDRTTYLREAVTTTTSSIAAPTILQLGSTESVGKGIVEVDEELMWVDSYDRVANTATIAPYGRGYLGTESAVHSSEIKVSISPTFPRFSIKRAINDTIKAMGANLPVVKSTTFVYNAAQTTYGFNDLKIDNILTVTWQSIGPSQEWIPVKRWDLDSVANATAFGSNAQTITISDSIISGRTVKIVYTTNPLPFTTNDQDYATQTGYTESTRDVVTIGAAYRLITYLDPARAAQVSPQGDETDSKRPYGASQTATKQLYALYSQRLKEEIEKQQNNYPPRVHFSRR